MPATVKKVAKYIGDVIFRKFPSFWTDDQIPEEERQPKFSDTDDTPRTPKLSAKERLRKANPRAIPEKKKVEDDNNA